MFPSNQIEDDHNFWGLVTLNLAIIYKLPFGSDREEIKNLVEFDPDQNVYNEQNLFNVYSCSFH